MAFEVVMPRLGWNMEVGAVASWRKRDGETVEAGEILFEIESDKAVQEVEAMESGVLRIPLDSPPVGQSVAVGTVLAYLVSPGEALPFSAKSAAAEAPPPVAAASTPVEKVEAPRRAGRQQPAISPRAARVATELGLDWTKLVGSGRTGRIVERDVRQAAGAQHAAPPLGAEAPVSARVSPVARRVADELGVDLAQLAAQLPGKRIERSDVEAAAQTVVAAKAAAAKKAVPVAAVPLPAGAEQRLPISQVRRVTAERMAASAHTTAPVTLTTEADATELVRLRQQLKEAGSQFVPTYNDLLAKLAALALQEFPQVNARFEGEFIVQSTSVNVGVAVDTERGLLVPVVRDVQAKSLRQIAKETAALIEQARSAQVSPDDLHGGTFTLTNLGMYEIDAFTPIINLPECAVLGVGRIVAKQVVLEADAERVAIRRMMFMSLTFDHRLVDGAPAARFLQRVKQFIEKPYLWLTQ
jgi:pyruvate dehydrogenase E2 component (dihydrolipoamide acetyltransferase)